MKINILAASVILASSTLAFAATPNPKVNNDKQDSQNHFQHRADILALLLNQNVGGIIQNDPTAARYIGKMLALSGRVDIDGGVASKTPTTRLFGRYRKGQSESIAVGNAIGYADFKPTDYLLGHVALGYFNNQGKYRLYDQNNRLLFPTIIGGRPIYTKSNFNLDEAFARLGDVNRFPLFVEAGRFYMPFGDYVLHPITQTLPQQLSETQGDGAEVGYVIHLGQNGGFSFVVYGFQTAQRFRAFHRDRFNGGAQAAYIYENGNHGFKIDVGYLNNMNDVNFISTTATPFPFNSYLIGGVHNLKNVHGIAADLIGHIGPFDAFVNYVRALSQFNPLDAMYNGRHARPSAIAVGTGYSFEAFKHANHLGISFQHSWQASGLGGGGVVPGAGLPRYRVQGNYTVNLIKQANLQFQLRYDKDYKRVDGGASRRVIAGQVRLSVGFA